MAWVIALCLHLLAKCVTCALAAPGVCKARLTSQMVHCVIDQRRIARSCLRNEFFFVQVALFPLTKAGRKRVFILCAVKGFRFPD